MAARWHRPLALLTALAAVALAPAPGHAQSGVRLVIDRTDGVSHQFLLETIRTLSPDGTDLVVRTQTGELRLAFTAIRRLRFQPTPTAVDPEARAWMEAIRLLQNRPNPVARSTTIGFDLARRGPVTLEVFSVSGRRIRRLADRMFEAGHHDVAWDGADDRGRRVEAGVYFYRIHGLGADQSRRAIVLP